METPLLFVCQCVVLMLISRNLHKKSSEVSIKAKSTPASLSFKGQETVKWSIISLLIDYDSQLLFDPFHFPNEMCYHSSFALYHLF